MTQTIIVGFIFDTRVILKKKKLLTPLKNENSNVLGLKSSINGNTVLGYKKGSKIKSGIGFGSTTPILWVVSLYSFAQKSTDTWEDFRK